MCKNGINSPEARRPVRLWVIALAHLAKIFAHLGKKAREI